MDDTSLFVTLGFQASIVFLQLFRCLSNHVEHLGGFGEFLIGQQQGELFGGQFLSMAEKPAPTLHRSRTIQRIRCDLKMI